MTRPASQERLAELAANLAAVRASIADACADAGRDPAEVALIAVTKTFPVPDIIALAGARRDRRRREQRSGSGAEGRRVRRRRARAALALRRPAAGQQGRERGQVRVHGALGGPGAAGDAPSGGGLARPAGLIRCLIQVSLDADAGAGARPGPAGRRRRAARLRARCSGWPRRSPPPTGWNSPG